MIPTAANRSFSKLDGWQTFLVDYSGRLFELIDRLSKRRALSCVLVAAVAMGIRIAVLPLLSFPEPRVHDEFGHLLGAETFVLGRLANPTHPMWVHFETFHENFVPTYVSQYPPGHALFLALGQKLLGHPWFGVWIGFGCMCASMCWMLQGWMPPVYALLGTLVAVGEIGLFGYWMNSYWGGAIAAAGGCLVLGALPRLARGANVPASILAALGIVILANTRPYEGMAVSLAAGFALLLWRRRVGRALAGLFAPRLVVPFVLICGVGAGWTAYYNYRTTGDPVLMPYVVNLRTYVMANHFFFLPERKSIVYRHDVMRRLGEYERRHYLRVRANPLLRLYGFVDILGFYCSTGLFLAILAGLFLSRSAKMRVATGMLGLFWLALLIETYSQPHYFAPGTGLLFLPAMYGVRWLRVRAQRFGAPLVLLFASVEFVHGLYGFVDGYRAREERHFRRPIVDRLIKLGGRHLVIVRYATDHDYHAEYVFNSANIDGSAIVWARDMGDAKDRELVDYYPDRAVWLLQPDPSTPSMVPYSAALAARSQ